MPTYVDSIPRVLSQKLGENPSLLDFGVIGDGTTDDTVNIQKGLDSVAAAGGGLLYAPAPDSFYKVTDELVVPAGVIVQGDGKRSLFKKSASLAAGKGLFRLAGDGSSLLDIQIDGLVTTSTGVDVATISDPAATALSQETSIWIPAGAANVLIQNVIITHTGGYAIFADARAGNIYNLRVLDCDFVNNRPHKFGPSGNEIYGSWTGGILLKNDGVSYGVKGVTVSRCRWSRVTGNCLWGHGDALGSFHENITFTDNTFTDFGLDGIEVGNMVGGVVSGNKFRRGGFLHSTDVDTSGPLTNPTTYSVALDSTGYVQGVSIDGNTVTNHNGGACDLDGFFDGNVTNNTFANALSSDPTYSQDQVGSFGPTKGIQTGNSYYRYAGRNIVIANNQIINFNTNAISLKNAKYCRISGNKIFHPSTASSIPILIFNYRMASETYATWLSDSTDRRSYGNTISGNTISYSGGNYTIAEIDYNDGTNTYPFQSTDENAVFNNPNPVANAYGEWLKVASSGSLAGFRLPTNDTTAAGISETHFQREGIGATAATKLYKNVAGTKTQIYQISDAAFINASVGGAANTGAFATGNRSTLAWPDAVGTGKLVADGLFAMGAGTYLDTDADLLGATWGLLRWNNTLHKFEQSISVSAGHRVWTDLSGTVSVPGATTQVIFNDAGAFGASANFVFDKTAQALTLTGLTGTPSVVAATSYIQAAEGFYTPSASASAINAPSGGVTALSLISIRNDAVAGLTLARTSATARQYGLGINASGGFFLNDATASADRLTMSTAGLISIGGTHVQIDQVGNISADAVIAATGASGFVSVPTNTSTQAIQVAAGGVTAKYFVVTESIFGIAVAAPSVSATNQGKLHFNSTSNKWEYSENGSSWANCFGGSGGVAGANTQIQFNNSGAFGGSTGLTWNDTTKQLAVTGVTTTAGITVLTAYINSAEGFLTAATAANAIQATSGGVTAKYLVTTESIFGTAVAAPALSAASQGKLHFNSTANKWQYSENGSSWANCFGAGSTVAGATNEIQYNNAGSFAASSNFTWTNGSKLLTITGATGTAGLTAVTCYIQSAEGFLTTSSASTAVNVASGGVTALSLISIRNDGVAGLTLQRTSATARQYGLGIDSAGSFFLNDATAGVNRMSITSGGTVNFIGPTGAAQVVYITAAASQASYLEFGPSTLWVEYQGDASGNWLVGHYGVAPGVFKSVRSGALANTLVLDSGRITVAGVAASASLSLGAGYMSSSEGYYTPGSATDSVKVPSGGVTAKYLIATESIFGIAVATPAVSAASQGKLHFNTTAQKWQYSENGGAWATCFGAGATVAGSNTQIQYNNSGAFGASANFTYVASTGVFTVTGPTNTNILSYLTASGTGSAFFLIGSAGGAVEIQTTTAGDLSINTNGVASGVVQIKRASSVAGTLILDTGKATIARQLVVGGVTSGQGILCSAGYIQSSEGFLTNATNTNAIQAPSGGVTAQSFDGVASGINAEFRLTSYSGIPAFIGRAALGSSGSPSQVLTNGTLMTIGGRGYHSSGAFTTSASASISFIATENWTVSAQGSAVTFNATPTGSTARAELLRITGGVAYNTLQTSAGVYALLGFTSDQGLYTKTLGTGTTPNTPGGGYGCIGHRSGATYWYWNGSSYASVDLSAGGGAVTSVTGGTGVTVSPTTGACVVSIGQAVGTGNSVTFANVTSSAVVQAGATGASITFQNTNYNFQVNGNGVVSCAGPINCSAGGSFGSTVSATGFTAGSGTSGGVGARAFNPRNSSGTQLYGADFTFQDLFGVTHTVWGGVLVS